MMNQFWKRVVTIGAVLAGTAGLSFSAYAHHSFAMYDMKSVAIYTGVVTRVDPQPNHLAIFFAPMNQERKNVERDESGEPIVWAVEMQGAAAMARRGVTVAAYPPGTVISVGLHPLRNGQNAGAIAGSLFKCPERTPPAAGMHCDSVDGSEQVGNEPLGGRK